MTHETKLLPCPFCGNDDLTYTESAYNSTVICRGCDGCIQRPNASATTHWNTRHIDPELKRKADMADELIRIRDVLVSAMKSECGRHLHQYGVENETLEVALTQAEQIARGE